MVFNVLQSIKKSTNLKTSEKKWKTDDVPDGIQCIYSLLKNQLTSGNSSTYLSSKKKKRNQKKQTAVDSLVVRSRKLLVKTWF